MAVKLVNLSEFLFLGELAYPTLPRGESSACPKVTMLERSVLISSPKVVIPL